MVQVDGAHHCRKWTCGGKPMPLTFLMEGIMNLCILFINRVLRTFVKIMRMMMVINPGGCGS